MDGVAVGTLKSGTLFYRGQTDVSQKQMNGVAWRLSRATSNESAPPVYEGDPDLYCTGFDLLGGEGYKYEGGMGFVGESGVLQSHGSGVCYYPGLGRFEGSWAKGEHKDVGVHTTASGSMYMGEWNGGLRQGYGCELGGDGDWYRGQFDDDAITGLGEMLWADGAIHRGKWVDGTLIEIAMSEEQNHFVDEAVSKAVAAKQRAMAARGAALISQQRAVDEAIRSIVYTRKRATGKGFEAEVEACRLEAEAAEISRKGKAQRERQAAQKTTALHDSTSQLEEEMFHINRQVPQGAEKSIAAYTASAANVDKKMKQALRDFKETEKMLIRAKADRKVAQLAGLRSEIDALEDDYEVGARALELPDAPTPSPTKQAKDTTTDAVTETSKPEMSGTTDVKSAPVVEAPKPTSEISRVRGGIARRKLRAKERAQEQTPGSPGNVM